VFAGYGIEAPELDHNDFEHIDIEGRIAVILSGAPAKFPNNQRAYYSSTLHKATTLSQKGAVGTITIQSLVDAKRMPWERVVAMSWAPQMRWLDAEGNPQDAYPDLKLRFLFKQESAAALFEQASMSLADALEKADAGEPQGFDLPGMMTLSATTGLRRHREHERHRHLGRLRHLASASTCRRHGALGSHGSRLERGRRFDL
jgi:hypothetical protein